MKLRIVAGQFGGAYLTVPDKAVVYRPTQERVRQSISEILKNRIPGAMVADFCAGSGAMGIEMISRGAKTVHFVESDRGSAQHISDQIRRFSITEQCRIFNRNVQAFIQTSRFLYDIIFFDPPYDDEKLTRSLPAMLLLLKDNGILVYEHASVKVKKCLPSGIDFVPAGFKVETREYGDTLVDFIVHL